MTPIDWNNTADWGGHVHVSATGSDLDAEVACDE